MLAVTISILLAVSIRVDSASTEPVLPPPSIREIVFVHPAGIIINWEPVKSDQVLGYKVKLWEARGIEVYRFKTVNGTHVLAKEIEKPKLAEFKTRDGKLYEYLVTGAQHSQLVLNGLKDDSPYLIQVLAFGARGDGEPSSPSGVQIISSHDKPLLSNEYVVT